MRYGILVCIVITSLTGFFRETIRLALRGSDKQMQKLCQLLRESKDQETHDQELLQFIDILISEVPSNE